MKSGLAKPQEDMLVNSLSECLQQPLAEALYHISSLIEDPFQKQDRCKVFSFGCTQQLPQKLKLLCKVVLQLRLSKSVAGKSSPQLHMPSRAALLQAKA